MSIRDQLHQAIDNGEEINIVYHGGSQPGASRSIIPITIAGDKLRARCLMSNTTKLFVVSKIEIADTTSIQSTQDWKKGVVFHEFATIEEMYNAMKDTLEGFGWHVEADEHYISLHRYFKNGKVRAGRDVSISYEEHTTETYIDEKGNPYHLIKDRDRPWSVFAKPDKHASFSNPDGAAERFMIFAEQLAPANQRE